MHDAVVVLAGGLGKRMGSPLPKVLHKIGSRTMIERSLDVVAQLAPEQIVVVVGYKGALVKKALGAYDIDFAWQKNQLGTAHALLCALPEIKKGIKNVLVVNGDDSAFYHSNFLKSLLTAHTAGKNVLTFATFTASDPTGLGRVVRGRSGKTLRIVEEKDATSEEKKIKEVNAGAYVFNKDWLGKNIAKVLKSEASGEYYLVDLVTIAAQESQRLAPYKISDPNIWHGINTQAELEGANEKLLQRVHFMGIAGAGASAAAGIASGFGYQVSGCDLNLDSPYTRGTKLLVKKGHSSSHISNVGQLVVSPAVAKLDPKNEEIIAAKKLNIPVVTWQEFQGKFLQKGKFVIAVAGAYGKSTTTAMIAQILVDAGLDPTCEIGAKVLDWKTNFRVGRSQYYVCEADEYNNNFVNFSPDIAVVLNMGWDHPDFFHSKSAVVRSYQKFVGNIKSGGVLIVPEGDEFDKLVKSVRRGVQVVRISDFGAVALSIIGNFRRENADAALVVAKVLKLNLDKAKKSVQNFKGLGRRLEKKGRIGKVLFYDDYAVQPYTIKTTANALSMLYPGKRILLVLEPHTISRLKVFFDQFQKSLSQTRVDKIFITNVFRARERGSTSFYAKKLANSVGKKAEYCGSLDSTAQKVAKVTADFDIVLSMGAGEIYKLYDLVKKVK